MSKEKERLGNIEQTLERLERYLIYLYRGLICIYPHASPERDTLHELEIHDKLSDTTMGIPENIRKIWKTPVPEGEQCSCPACEERRERNKDNKCKWWKPMRFAKEKK